MRKIFVFLTVLTMMIITCALSEQINPDIAETTTDKTITFLGIDWLSSESTAEEIIKQQFPEIDYREKEDNPSFFRKVSYNFTDDTHEFLPYYESANVQTRIIEFKKKGAWKDTYTVFGKVAGYPIDNITLRFIKTDPNNYKSYGLFEATYYFSTLNKNSSITVSEQYLDLKQKLSDLYGTPHVSAIGDNIAGARVGENAVWISKDGTAVNLQYDKYLSGYMKDGEFIYLKYGTTVVNDIFIKQEIELQREQEQKNKEERDAIQNDNSGL